eukprot:3584505-Pleurochrysis_carterae.AAC.1
MQRLRRDSSDCTPDRNLAASKSRQEMAAGRGLVAPGLVWGSGRSVQKVRSDSSIRSHWRTQRSGQRNTWLRGSRARSGRPTCCASAPAKGVAYSGLGCKGNIMRVIYVYVGGGRGSFCAAPRCFLFTMQNL